MSQPIFKVPGIRPAMFHYSPPGGGGSALKCQGPVLPGQLHIIWEARYINGGPPDNPTDKQGLADGATVTRWPDRSDHYPLTSQAGLPIYNANGGPGGVAAQYAGSPSTTGGGGPSVTFAASNTGLVTDFLPFLTYCYFVIVANIRSDNQNDGTVVTFASQRTGRIFYTDQQFSFTSAPGPNGYSNTWAKNGVNMPTGVAASGWAAGNPTGNAPFDLGQPLGSGATAWRVYESWPSGGDTTGKGQDKVEVGSSFNAAFDLALLYVAPNPVPDAAERDQLLNYIRYWYGITSTLP